ncbi:MAG TPA: ferrous iron transport protein A [Anaerolineae bacterium]|nr:ferrous iron transport protein A [Anaerolineae bacterium]
MNQIVPLDVLAPGARALVHQLQGGHRFISRMAAMGFTPGAEIVIVQNYRRGPLIVAIRDTHIALGRGEAKRVLVEVEGSRAERHEG